MVGGEGLILKKVGLLCTAQHKQILIQPIPFDPKILPDS